MSELDLTGFADAFKELYPEGLSECLYEASPLYGWMPKADNFGSDFRSIVPFIGGVRGSNDFDIAKANKSTVTTDKFLVPRVRTYALASIDRETMLASQKGDHFALASALETTTRGAMYEIEKAVGHQLYSNQGGWRVKGDGSWTISGQTVTVDNATDLHHLEIGDRLVAATTDGTTGSAKSGYFTVAAIDPEAGTFDIEETAANDAGAIPGIANTDYLFRQGDFGNCMAGIRAWIPTTLPAGTFFGVDRTVHRQRLAGLAYAGGNKLMEKTVLRAAAKLRRYGAKGGDYALFMHPEREAELVAGLHSKTEIDIETDMPTVMYTAVTIATALGKIPIIADPYCPYDQGFLLKKSSWELSHLGEHPHFVTDMGGKLIVEPNSDGFEFRIAAYHNNICFDPNSNCNITW